MAHDCSDCTRRLVLHTLGIAVAGTIVGLGCGGSGSDTVDAPAKTPDAPSGSCPTNELCIDVTKAGYTSLANTNGYAVVSSSKGQLIVVRTGTSTVAALSAICTHQGCTVNYSSSTMLLVCPCHGAEFTLTGSVKLGPASVPLKTYAATVSGNIITITLA